MSDAPVLPMQEVRRYTKPLPCDLVEADYARLGRELAGVLDELDAALAREESVKKELKAANARIEARRSEIAQKLRGGAETRDVEVVCRTTEAGVVQEIRSDTGEVLVTRPAQDSERQMLLELHPPADNAPARTDEEAAGEAAAATEAGGVVAGASETA